MLRVVSNGRASFRLHVDSDIEQSRYASYFTKEPETICWIEEFFSEADVFLDVGANIGVFTLYAAAKHEHLKIYAVEPACNNLYKLARNIHVNNYNERVIPLGFALGAGVGYPTLQLSTLEDGSASHSLGNSLSQKEASEDTFKQIVATVALDDLIKRQVVPCPQHVKIDVDGTELQVVKGMQDTLNNSTLKSILMEVDYQLSDTKEIFRRIETAGFTIDTPINSMSGHSRERRKVAGHGHIENVVFVRS